MRPQHSFLNINPRPSTSSASGKGPIVYYVAKGGGCHDGVYTVIGVVACVPLGPLGAMRAGAFGPPAGLTMLARSRARGQTKIDTLVLQIGRKANNPTP